MAEIERSAQAVWTGDLRAGRGRVTAASGALADSPYSFGTRFQDQPGTNPEELVAAAHAACYNMALAHALANQGHPPDRLETEARCTLRAEPGGGFTIAKVRLVTRGQVPGMDEETFGKAAEDAERRCPVSKALRGNVEIQLAATLIRAG
ncbi:MAG: OsmC family protein [Candidatus Bipolaricaulaceae bacterium]